MADTFKGLWLDPFEVVIIGLDVPVPEGGHPLADPDRLKDPPDESMILGVGRYGVKEPIVITRDPLFPGQWVVVAGRQRTMALRIANTRAEKAGDEFPAKLPCVQDRGDNFTTMTLENEHRKERSVISKAEQARLHSERGMNDAEICILYKITTTTLANWRALLSATPDVRAAVVNGKITPTLCYELGRLPAAEQALALEELCEPAPETHRSERDPVKGARAQSIVRNLSARPSRWPAKRIAALRAEMAKRPHDPEFSFACDLIDLFAGRPVDFAEHTAFRDLLEEL